MRKTGEYRRHAAQCRKMALLSASGERRQRLLQMADTWDALAREREEQIARQRRIAELERGYRSRARAIN